MIEKTQDVIFADDLEDFLVEVAKGLKRFALHEVLRQSPQVSRRLDYIVHDCFVLAHDLDLYSVERPMAASRGRLNGSRKETHAS